MQKKLENWYSQETTNGNLIVDPLQLDVIHEFDGFIEKFNQKVNWLQRLFARQPLTLGFYIYGTVGTGKSMLMNAFYTAIDTHKKIRIHFHEFMADIHQQLANLGPQLSDNINPLSIIAKNLQQKYSIIFLDEMHVSDIATAMILKNLFENLFEQQIYIVTSSNYQPDELYPNGLMRDRFLPAIILLKQKLTILALNSPVDYRLTNIADKNQLFFSNSVDAVCNLSNIFIKIAKINPIIESKCIYIKNREIAFIKKSKNIIWFDFKIICGDMRSQLDHLELSSEFDWFIISDVNKLTDDNNDVARRFTWLIDILYDNNKKLALSSNCNMADIFLAGNFVTEFGRTLSRLNEMQTTEYLNKLPTNKIIET